MLTATLLMTPMVTKAKEVYSYEIKEVDVEVTCYYPDDSLMEGGYQAANLEWLDSTEYTCAAPKCIPFNSEVTLKGVKGWRDGKTYRVNDRGEAIIVDSQGEYHIDLLVSCKEVADNFGRQHCKAIIKIPCNAGNTY